MGRFGSRKVVSSGLSIVALGLLLLAQSDVHTPYWHLVVAIVTMAVGMGLSMAPSTTGIMASVPMRKAGVGSAVNDTTRELGGALGVAVLGSLLASKFTGALPASVAGLPGPAQAVVKSSLGGALGVARSLPPAVGGPLEAAAKTAYVDAMSVSLVAAAVVAFAAAVMVRRFYPDRFVMHHEIHGPGTARLRLSLRPRLTPMGRRRSSPPPVRPRPRSTATTVTGRPGAPRPLSEVGQER